ncbi:MAG: DUF4113 domain-containing protein [Caulobacteraceae bacterium]
MMELVAASRRVAADIWRAGFDYTKAGVICDSLVAQDQVQRPLIGARDRVRSAALMGALDEVNRRWSRGSLVSGAAGGRPTWTQRANMRSARYTTRADELPVARA